MTVTWSLSVHLEFLVVLLELRSHLLKVPQSKKPCTIAMHQVPVNKALLGVSKGGGYCRSSGLSWVGIIVEVGCLM
jgi:hypothetical protein